MWRWVSALFVGCTLSLTGAGTALAVTCTAQAHDGNGYTVCAVDMTEDDLRLFLRDSADIPFGQFRQVDAMLRARGEKLAFAMNAGMYHDDRAPVGHYVENGTEQMRVITNPGPGNFGLLPNGVLCIRPERTDVIETLRYVEQKPDCTYATQSGPMLVIDGALHPRFLVDSTSRYIRNGVGTSDDGKTAYFVISENGVTFHQFGRFFRDVLKVPQALFLDGNISRLYAPQLGRSDIGRWMGPIVGVVESGE
ncbi:phosphodiester glycosidase family protein [Puniceibacterium confluentis]|uniref:phosphodiester glycosidase family protein n=1 Tax=Puniceibacterium confluentis TaxID=1958944 RepID=UPI0011B79AFC|nr:phosphodiester glycosidase family protein [Puniceibacterium confluentis]